MSNSSSVPFPAYNQTPYKSTRQPSGDAVPTRPKLARENTSDNLLSYYSSSIANEGRDYSHPRPQDAEKSHSTRPLHAHAKKASASSSSSDYSDDSEVPDVRPVFSEISIPVKRRSGTASAGGGDKRRIAIVQMDSVIETPRNSTSTSDTVSSSNSIRSRRTAASNLTGLALVGPPDASVRSYSHFTPPSTAPVTADYRNHHLNTPGHHRSASENPAERPNVPSRDTGSVGEMQGTHRTNTAPFLSPNNARNTKEENKNTASYSVSDAFRRTTASRTPSPVKQPYLAQANSPSDRAMTSQQIMSPVSVTTPSIGEGKQIDMPVAGPVVIKLDSLPSRASHSTPSWRSDSPSAHSTASNPVSSLHSASSSYLRYEPGVHATAGPLPPPPRAMFNIDIHSPPPPRPPRLHSPATTPTASRIRGDMEAVKQALQLPPSVDAVLSSKKLSSSFTTLSGLKEDKESQQNAGSGRRGTSDETNDEQELSRTPSVHRREAATSSDTSSILVAKDKVAIAVSSNDSDEAVSVTVIEPQTRPPPMEPFSSSKFDKWLQENPDAQQEGRRSTSLDERHEINRSLSPPLDSSVSDAPSPPPKSLRTSFTNNLKRFSSTLPRSPSLSSRSGKRLSSSSTRYTSSSRTPSPSIALSSPPAFKKIRSSNPSALFCHEVHGQHTTLQRCAIYAAKINELYVHDCGLMDWLEESRSRGSSINAQRGPSTRPFTPQPRQTSRSSMISDATFPIRNDATVATDLLQGAYRDFTPPGMPPLPYPSLAMNPPVHSRPPTRSQSTASSATPTSSIRSLGPTPSIKGGFFASLGRKASISTGARKDKYLPTISNPIPVSVGMVGRATSKHSHTSFHRVGNSPNLPTVPGGPRAPPNRPQRSQTFMASGSALSSSQRSGNEDLNRRPSLFNLSSEAIPVKSEFSQQVDKLHALLPQADREILAGYLRHAGQDMLAIGQYLEDERMGTIQRF